MAETVKALQGWLNTLPQDAEVGIGEGGLTLYVVDDPEAAAKGSGEYSLGEYYELGGLPEGDDRT